MKRFVVLTAFALMAAFLFGCNDKSADPGPSEDKPSGDTKSTPDIKPGVKPVVVIETSKGTIKAELWPDKAPRTVKNFLAYVKDKHYDGLIFHRVIKGFMIQGGGFTPDMQQKKVGAPIMNEARLDTPNDRGTLAMARTPDVHSATAQFFINHKDNAPLNHRAKTPDAWGYCVFGKVVEGMDVVDAIASVKTTTKNPYENVPAEPVIIKSIRQVK